MVTYRDGNFFVEFNRVVVQSSLSISIAGYVSHSPILKLGGRRQGRSADD
jgi:hypothetical protein